MGGNSIMTRLRMCRSGAAPIPTDANQPRAKRAFPMLRALAFVLVMAFAAASPAADDVKQQKIAELIRTTKLQDMFEQQIAQSRASYLEFGKKILAQIQNESDVTDPAEKARLDAIFQRYLKRGTSLWKAEDLVALWSQHYGQDLSSDDLDQILAFYKSPIGQKAVAASQAATAAFTNALAIQSQQRLREAIEQLAADLRGAITK
ncbi:MAG: DUF2059 domain-containing protein [Hyphomicrobiales bacterium]